MRLYEFENHTILWHGTSSDVKSKGLRMGGRLNGVYLTDNPDLAFEYAMTDAERTGSDVIYLLSIDITQLDMSLMQPDDDHTNSANDWVESLSETDQCVYYGDIPSSAINVEQVDEVD